MIRTIVFMTLVASVAGCLPSTKVYKNPGDRDRGVRFYRPKPYLMVKPLVDRAGQPVEGYVSIDTVMLPDFGEEYSIHVRSGWGTNETRISLADGWRLDGLNVDLDSSTDENLRAVADLVKLIPTLTSAADDATRVTAKAANVPLGYYESVVSRDRDGRKRLYGFRYVGFLPYAACPQESCGWERTDCYSGQVFALVFERDSLTFRPLHEVSDPDRLRTTASELPPPGRESPADPLPPANAPPLIGAD